LDTKALLVGIAAGLPALAAAGGIDHKVEYDDSGIWHRNVQVLAQATVVGTVVIGALSEGNDTRLGHALWQSFDAMAIGAVTAQGMKYAFSRARPTQTDDPGMWFQGPGHKSFPSGEVMTMTTAVTPLILEYGQEYPAVWALAALPVYDGIARVKVNAHWQTDVLASMAIGTALGVYAHSRPIPISVSLLPHGVTVGWRKSF
jgi:membrane-associated phospholipid phosphatase